jgi:hypothetical protein
MRISGVRQSDAALLMIYLEKKNRHSKIATVSRETANGQNSEQKYI